MSASLEGKAAIVTGSSRSLGAAIAKQLAADGAHVVVNYLRNFESAEAVAKSINQNRTGAAIAVQADASTLGGGHKLVDECLRAFGRVDIVVLNAGILGYNKLEEVDEEFFDSVFNLHVKGPLFLTKAAVPYMSVGMQTCHTYNTIRISFFG